MSISFNSSCPWNTLLFDLDGTLVDTEIIAARAVERCYKKWKINIDPQNAAHVTGRTWKTALTFLFGKYPPPIRHDQATQIIQKQYAAELQKGVPEVPGSKKAIQSLASHFTLGLVSGSRKDEILLILNQLGITQHFDLILSSEDYPQSKPAPDGYLKALSTLQRSPEECLVFEDSEAGIQAAKAAKMHVIAITSTNHFNQNHDKADWQIPDLTSLTPQWVEELSLKK